MEIAEEAEKEREREREREIDGEAGCSPLVSTGTTAIPSFSTAAGRDDSRMPETRRRMLRIPRRPGGRFGDLPPRHAGHEAPLVTPACSASADKHFNPGRLRCPAVDSASYADEPRKRIRLDPGEFLFLFPFLSAVTESGRAVYVTEMRGKRSPRELSTMISILLEIQFNVEEIAFDDKYFFSFLEEFILSKRMVNFVW